MSINHTILQNTIFEDTKTDDKMLPLPLPPTQQKNVLRLSVQLKRDETERQRHKCPSCSSPDFNITRVSVGILGRGLRK